MMIELKKDGFQKLMLFLLIASSFTNCNQAKEVERQKSAAPTIMLNIYDTLKIDNTSDFVVLHDSVSTSSDQILLVYNDSIADTTGKLVGFEKSANGWKRSFNSSIANLGKNGFAFIGEKLEGDGKTPSGIFKVGEAFGYEDNLNSKMDFITLQDHHYWISNPASQDYNKLVEYVSKDSKDEKMLRKDHLYKYGIIIRYNMDKVVKNKGSAIFIHVERRKGSPTAGCISLEEQKLTQIIKWLSPEKNPSIVMGTKNEIFSKN